MNAENAEDRLLVLGLFASTCLLSLVSWYTTWRGMNLYLAGWFAFLASLGVQSALVLVAWLVGLTKSRRPILIAVYVITATVSIAFSYASLYTWFSAKERPAQAERKLFDTLLVSAGSAEQLLANAASEAQKHVMALDEMTTAEKAHGYISKAQDSDPYLAKVREAVAQEAQSLGTAFQEGTGQGVRYTAFDRYAKLAKQSLERIQASQRAVADFKARLKPLDPSDQQIRAYREVYDAVSWKDAEEALHAPRFEKPAIPSYGDNLDRSDSGQEDLLIAFQELFTAPTARHLLALLLAAFIDVIVFLLAYGAGPHLAGAPEVRWCKVASAIDGLDPQVFIRSLLRKLESDGSGIARAQERMLSPGERHLFLLLCAHGGSTLVKEGEERFFLLEEGVHEVLVDALSRPGLPFRAAARPAQA